MCSITSGAANLILDLWVRALSDVHMLEGRLENRLSRQELRVVKRAVVLRTVKHVGRVLDHQGRSAAVAPLNYWEPQAD